MTDINKENLTLAHAKVQHIESIQSMYHSVIGQEGCAWNKLYPSEIELNHDYETENLYVLLSGDELLGAISVVPEDELDDLNCRTINDGTRCEIARVVVPPKFQGNGFARKMIVRLIPLLLKKGIRSIHLLVAKNNQSAIKTYQSLGFEFLGECSRYNNDFYICEKLLTAD